MYSLIWISKTMWNNNNNCLCAMLGRILEIKSSISKAFIDCNQELGTFDLEKLVSSLEPAKFGAEKLVDRSSTLLAAEVICFVNSERIGAIK